MEEDANTKKSGKSKNDQVGRVYGPQVEIESTAAKGAESGYIYGEAYGGGWRTPKEKPARRQDYLCG